jgi:hypothetical protein
MLDMCNIYTMSFVASPWDSPHAFQLIPQLSLRVTVEPTIGEVIDTEAELTFERKYADIMLPDRYVYSKKEMGC